MEPFNLATAAALSTAASQTTGLNTSMDPRLQRYVICKRLGQTKAASSSTSADEVAVIARVTSATDWEELSEVRVGAILGSNDGDMIVTGRIPISRIENVRKQSFVKSLKAAQAMRPSLAATTEETLACPDLLPVASQSAGGEGVVIGIIDFGCDFAHQNFRQPSGATRLLAIWDQNGGMNTNAPFNYGQKYTTNAINSALQSIDPYAALGYGPQIDSGGSQGTHGTHVMDIAAGNGRGSNVAGVAPAADLVFVELAATDVAWSGKDVLGGDQGQSFGDSVQLLEALKFIFDEAGDRPCVINLSLGTNGGPHDGTTLVEQGIDSLISQKPNRSVVIAASNSYADGIHTSGTVPNGGTLDLVWSVPMNDQTHNELEVWYAGEERISVELLGPNGSSLLKVAPGVTDGLTAANGDLVVLVANRLADPNNHDNMINIFMEAGSPAGLWTVRLTGDQVTSGSIHAWIERDDASPSQFAPPTDDTHTIGSISCGKLSISVGSYDAHKKSRPLSWFSSAGPTRDGRQKPEISAPGHAVLAAWSRTKTNVTLKSGTSMASPAVSGIVALAFAEARKRSLDLSGEKLRELVIQASRRNPPEGDAWHERYGYGRLSAQALLQAVIDEAEKLQNAGNAGDGGKTGNDDTGSEPTKSVKKPKHRTKKKSTEVAKP